MKEKKQGEGSILFRGKTYSSIAIKKASIVISKSLKEIQGNVGILTENPAFVLAAMLGIQQAGCKSFELNPFDGFLYIQSLREKYSLSAIVTDVKSDLEDSILKDTVWEEFESEAEVTELDTIVIRENSVKAEPIYLTTREGQNCIQFLEDTLKRDLQNTIYVHDICQLWNPFLLEAVLTRNICIEVLETEGEETDVLSKLRKKNYTSLYMSFTGLYQMRYAICTEKDIKAVLHDVITYGNEFYDVCSIKEYFYICIIFL